MIIPVGNLRWELVKKYPSKVIMMTRDAEEIRQSQMAYYRKGNITIEEIRTHLTMQEMRLKKHNIDYMVVDYHDVLNEPVKIISEIAQFIGSTKIIDAAVNSVQPQQNRFKKGELYDGI